MFPNVSILGLNLYEIFLTLGIVMALIVLRVYGDKKNIEPKVFNFYLVTGVVAIIVGYFSAVLFQAFYNGLKSGVFTINSETGATFLGGLIGGVAVFLLIFLIAGKYLFKDNAHKKHFKTLLALAPCAITLAHAIGRLGCFSVGCCGGIETDSIFGLKFPYQPHKVVPTQLIESLFLFALFAVLSIMYFKDICLTMPIYLIAYGVFRFFIEFLRDDDRGQFIIKALSPSQGVSIILVVTGIVVLYGQLKVGTKK